MTTKGQLLRLGSILLDIVFPRLCAVCGLRLGSSERCVCLECGLTLPRYREETYAAKERLLGSPLVRSLSAPFTYQHQSESHHLITALKYKSYREVASFVVRTAITEGCLRFSPEDIDLILPVPIEEGRLQKRGYNQAGLLAQAMSQRLGRPWSEDYLLRRRGSHSQTAFGRKERMENAHRAFSLTPNETLKASLRGKRILLIDDLLTTGATLLTLCDLLEGCGVRAVHVFVAAVAIKRY